MKSSEKWHFVTAKYVFSFYFLLPHLKICPPCPSPKTKIPPLFRRALDFPFHHNPQNSQTESSIQSREVGCTSHWRAAEIYSEMRHVCTSWGCCLISTHSPCQLENEGLNLNWWFISVQLSHQLCSHVTLVFSLWPLLTKLCLPLMRMGCWCPAQMLTAVCNSWNKRRQLRAAEQSVLPDNGGVALAIDKSKPANLCWGTRRWNTSSWDFSEPWSGQKGCSDLQSALLQTRQVRSRGNACAARGAGQSLRVTSSEDTHL